MNQSAEDRGSSSAARGTATGGEAFSVRRAGLRLFMAAMAMVIATNIGIAGATGSPDTGNYPYAAARPSGNYSEWYIDKNGDGRYSGEASLEGYDHNGFAYRNCTSYVAWLLESKGIRLPYGRAMGNAKLWDDNAPKHGFVVDTTPRPGDVAVWNRGRYGHVAYVESVNADGTVNISEYNALPAFAGRYSRRSSVRADSYIHFEIPQPVTEGQAATVAKQTEPANDAAPVITNMLYEAMKPPAVDSSVITGAKRTTETKGLTGGWSESEPSRDGVVLTDDFDGDDRPDVLIVKDSADGTYADVWLQTNQQKSFRHRQIAVGEKVSAWLTASGVHTSNSELLSITSSGEIYTYRLDNDTDGVGVKHGKIADAKPDYTYITGDYDGDNKTDIGIVSLTRPSQVRWVNLQGVGIDE